MAVTIRDIAQRAGVSVSTASRALNKKSDVSKETRLSVLAAARDLSYAVNLHARALTGATSRMLGFILYDSSTLFHAAMARGVEDMVTAQRYSLVVCNTLGVPEAELRAHQMLLEKRVDGVLINSVQSGAAPLQRLQHEGVPYVLLNRFGADAADDYVKVDYQLSAYVATAHLLELGHRRILHHTANEDHPPVRERVLGYQSALADHGVPFDPALVIYSGQHYARSYDFVIHAMTHLHPRPTAILAYNDLWAIPVYKALSDLMLRVPDDVAVVGHNDLEFAGFLTPPLTSVAQPVYDMGQKGAEILLQKITWPSDEQWLPRQVTLPPTLVVRASTASPSAVRTSAVPLAR